MIARAIAVNDAYDRDQPTGFEHSVLEQLSTGAFQEALRLCKARLAEDGTDALACHYAAIALRHLNACRAALDFHALAIQRAPLRALLHFELGVTFQTLRLWADAQDAFDIAIRLAPADADMKVALARCLVLSAHPDSVRKIEAMLEVHPKSTDLHRFHAIALFADGRRKDAVAAIKAVLEMGNKDGVTLYHLVKYCDAEDLNALDPVFEDALQTPAGQADHMVHFAKAELDHKRGAHAQAHKHYCVANRMRFKTAKFDPLAEDVAEKEMVALFSGAVPEAPAPPDGAPSPIFIVGMPRSGSTLCETILAAHSAVTPLGEIGEIVSAVRRLGQLPFDTPAEAILHVQESYLSSAPVSRTQTPWVVDKYLGNFFYLGHILHAFPNAKVLHVNRDPRAVAWSIFRHCFAEGEAGFAYSSADIVAFHGMYTRMMAFWSDQFGDRIVHLSYDELVARPNHVIPSLLDQLGLPWEDRCLHPERVQRPVATASVGQTAQPIYQGSSDVWRAYAPYTDGWLDQLDMRLWR